MVVMFLVEGDLPVGGRGGVELDVVQGGAAGVDDHVLEGRGLAHGDCGIEAIVGSGYLHRVAAGDQHR
jgi:hypothetical protein